LLVERGGEHLERVGHLAPLVHIIEFGERSADASPLGGRQREATANRLDGRPASPGSR
jgi:hypothetical protein